MTKKIARDGVLYLLNDDEKKAYVIGICQQIDKWRYHGGEINIASFIKYNLKEYIVTSILKRSFSYINYIGTLKFSDDSQLQTIEEEAFFNTTIKSIDLPSSLIELKKGWCNKAISFNLCTVNPNNKYFKSYEQFILRKSSQEKEDFDVLVFSNGKDVNIPNFIEIIEPYAFRFSQRINFESGSKLRIFGDHAFDSSYFTSIKVPPSLTKICENAFANCSKLREVIIPTNSKLEIIEKNAFFESAIESIYFPSSLKKLEEGWCNSTFYLNNIEISEDNEHYIKYEKEMILGKTNQEKDIFDVIIFVNRNIENLKIPNFIEVIEAYSFDECHNIKEINFESNSKLKIIKSHQQDFLYYESIVGLIKYGPFTNTSLQKITFPSSLTELYDGWCSNIYNLVTIDVMQNNKYYKLYNDKFIIGKSNPESDEYDILVFAARDVETTIIPASIKIIGSYAFQYCKKLKTVEIPSDSKLQIIEEFAFSNSSIEKISISSQVTHIKNGAFLKCEYLNTVKIPSNSKLQIIDQFAFHKTNISSFFIPESLTRICKYAFGSCHLLKNVEISFNSKLQIIEEFAFEWTNIESIFIPHTVKEISNEAFANCRELQKVEIPKNSELIKIGDNAFCDTKIKSIFIPQSIQRICSRNFMSTDIQNFEIPLNPNLKIIESFAFCMSKIKSIYIPSQITQIDRSAFFYCRNIQNVEIPSNSELQAINQFAFAKSAIETLYIPSKITEIDEYVFYECENLRNIEISKNSQLQMICRNSFESSSIENIIVPPSVKLIDDFAFMNCEKLKKVSFSLDSELQKIGKAAFKYSSIESIRIPPHVKIIDDFAFENCEQIQKIEFSLNSELQTIGKKIFGSSSIQSITLPASIKVITENAFANCSKLQEVIIPANSKLEIIEKNAFFESAIESIYFPSSLKKLEEGWCNSTFYLNNIEISEDNEHYIKYEKEMILGKTNQEKDIFDVIIFVNRNIENLKIPNFIEVIEAYSFDECHNIKEINFESNSKLKIIKDYAFCNCTKVHDIIIPQNTKLQIIQDGAFDSTAIESITIPRQISRIGNLAFSGCKFLYKFEIPIDSQIEIIEESLFGYSNVSSFLIPSNVKKINRGAFGYCFKLQIIEIDENSKLENICWYMFYTRFIEETKIIMIPPKLKNRVNKSCRYQVKS